MRKYLAKHHVVLKLEFSRNLTKAEFQIPNFVRFCKEALVEKAIDEGKKIWEIFKNAKNRKEELNEKVIDDGQKISEIQNAKNRKEELEEVVEKVIDDGQKISEVYQNAKNFGN